MYHHDTEIHGSAKKENEKKVGEKSNNIVGRKEKRHFFSENKICSRQSNFRLLKEELIFFFFKVQNPHRDKKKLLNINLH